MGTGYIPSYDGIFMFGEGVVMHTGDPDREVQTASFFGLNGIASINGGSRGRRTMASGVLIGDSLFNYNTAEGNFYDYLNAGNYILIDSQGRTWGQVRLVAFSPADEPIRQDVMTGQVLRHYSCAFQHMI